MSNATQLCSRRNLVIGCIVLGVLGLPALRFHRAWKYRASDEALAAGRQLFEHRWSKGDPLARNGDGLGPVFNARSCAECHFQGGIGGGGPNEKNVLAFEVLPTNRDPTVHAGVVHAFATYLQLKETQDAVQVLFPIVPGGPRLINGCSINVPDFNPVQFTSINTPALFGIALIEREISDFAIHCNGASRSFDQFSRELSADFSATPVGLVRVVSGNRTGRFGWKAQFATLEEFVAAACAAELGLTNPLRHQDIPQQHVPDPDAGLDLDSKQLGELVAYVASLPRPTQILPAHPDGVFVVNRGEELFSIVGCADCHTPNLGRVEGLYSDLRLYNLEPPEIGSSYGNVQPEVLLPANEPELGEWKTPPLWGVADSAPYFHDGASPTLETAILRHNGNAKGSKQKFIKLDIPDRQALIAFLKSLRAPQIARSSDIAGKTG